MPMCVREEWGCPVEKLKEKIVQLEKEKAELLDKCMSLDYGKSRAESWLQDTLREKSRLEREADWLAWNCETLSGYNPILRQGMTRTQWREAAREAVQDANK